MSSQTRRFLFLDSPVPKRVGGGGMTSVYLEHSDARLAVSVAWYSDYTFMVFQWHGGDTIHMAIKRKEGADVSLITDPMGPFSPKSLSRSIKADIVVASFNQPEKDLASFPSQDPERAPLVITSPGEYERQSFFITGIRGTGEGKEVNTLYRFDGEELAIGYLAGATGALNEAQTALFEGVHVLIVPVGGEGLEMKTAVELIQAVDPSVVIGIRTKSKEFPKSAGIETIAKMIGIEAEMVSGNYKLTKNDLLEDQAMKIVGFNE